MIKEILKKTGRRGAAAIAVAALATVGVGLSTGIANADGPFAWYWLNEHPTGHGVGVYSAPNSESGKVANNLSSTASSLDGANLICWTTGEDIQNQGDVWYYVNAVSYDGNADDATYKDGYIYGGYADGNWNYDYGGLSGSEYHC